MRPLGRGLQFRLVREHTADVVNAAWQVPLKLILVGSDLWRSFATALHSLPSGLGVNWSYRAHRSTPTPAYETLRGVGALRNALASSARSVARLTGAHQRVAFRADGYLAERRRPNYANGDEPDAG